MMLSYRPCPPERQEYFNKLRNAVDPSRTNLTNWADLQNLEKGLTVPHRSSSR